MALEWTKGLAASVCLAFMFADGADAQDVYA